MPFLSIYSYIFFSFNMSLLWIFFKIIGLCVTATLHEKYTIHLQMHTFIQLEKTDQDNEDWGSRFTSSILGLLQVSGSQTLCASESSGGLVTTQIAGPCPPSFWFTGYKVGPENAFLTDPRSVLLLLLVSATLSTYISITLLIHIGWNSTKYLPNC